MEIANTSGAVWLLMLDISERPSEEGDNPQDLSLLCLGNTWRVSLSCGPAGTTLPVQPCPCGHVRMALPVRPRQYDPGRMA